MGPTWIAVILRKDDSGASVKEFTDEQEAHAVFETDRQVAARHCYLATVRAEAKS